MTFWSDPSLSRHIIYRTFGSDLPLPSGLLKKKLPHVTSARQYPLTGESCQLKNFKHAVNFFLPKKVQLSSAK